MITSCSCRSVLLMTQSKISSARVAVAVQRANSAVDTSG